MRKATRRLLLFVGCASGLTSCAPALGKGLRPDLPEYRLAILVRPVGGRCRTTTIPALAIVTPRQTVIWEVMSFDPAACKPADVTLAAKSMARASDKGQAFAPTRGERGDTWSVRNLQPGRYKYDVRIGSETEDPELDVWR
jgi:hypothetical protein